MLKNACQYLSVTVAVFAFSMFFTPPNAGAAPVLVHQFGKFQGPARVVQSDSGNIYVTDYKQGLVKVYDETGQRIAMHKNLSAPLGLAVYDPPLVKCKNKKKGKRAKVDCSPTQPIIYVGDEGDGSVQIINNGDVSSLGIGSGEFIKPNGIAVTSAQQIYVVDSKANQVKVYDNLGDFQFAFVSEWEGIPPTPEDPAPIDQLNFPLDIVLNETLGEAYVSDFWNKRIVVFDLAGNWLRNIQTPLNGCGSGGGDPVYLHATGLGIDPDGNLYVADNALSTVTILTSMGALIDVIGISNCEYWTGQVPSPRDVASDGQRIYVASGGKGLVQVFEVTP